MYRFNKWAQLILGCAKIQIVGFILQPLILNSQLVNLHTQQLDHVQQSLIFFAGILFLDPWIA